MTELSEELNNMNNKEKIKIIENGILKEIIRIFHYTYDCENNSLKENLIGITCFVSSGLFKEN